MKNKVSSLIGQLQLFEKEISRLEGRMLEIEERIQTLVEVERNHLVRVKNREDISDEFIIAGRKYLDLSPEKAWKLYCNKDFDFILVDVCSKDFERPGKLKEAIYLPWEDFKDRFLEIQSKSTPILIISEDGATSVLACEFLAQRGYYNCNNISGGYKFWKGFRLSEVREESA